jgi:hypothetical protein
MKSEKLRKFLFLFFTSVIIAGCTPATKIAIMEAGVPVVNGISSIHGKALVESRAGKTLVVEYCDLNFRYKTRELATGRLILPIEVPAGGISRVRYDVAIENSSLAKLRTLMSRMEINPEQVFVDVKAKVRYGNIRRTVEMKDVPYSEFILNFVP